MSNEYIALAAGEKVSGLLAVSKAVIEGIAAKAVSEVKNVRLLDKTNFNRPVNCRIEDHALFVDVAIRIQYDCNIADACVAVQNRINQALEQMLAMTCQEIEVKVVGFIF